DATKDAILRGLESLKTTSPQDVVVIYLAGHGDSAKGRWFFVPYELVYPDKEEDLREKSVSSDDLREGIAAIGARKVVLLLDACKSGSALLAFALRGFEEQKALRQLARASGVHVIAASGKDQFAAEVKELGHGVFTYTLLEALRGGADGSPKDGVVNVRELLSYVEKTLPDISEKHRSEPQFPVVDSRGMDFPLAIVR
ncbi:caspase domain-containing protein, partial [Elusimicrobiota bacterium]